MMKVLYTFPAHLSIAFWEKSKKYSRGSCGIPIRRFFAVGLCMASPFLRICFYDREKEEGEERKYNLMNIIRSIY
jgi:hypothetical protein